MNKIDNCLRRLDDLASSTYRRDFRETANSARNLIRALLLKTSGDRVSLALLAQQISERAALKPQVVYRRANGAVAWKSAGLPSLARIPEARLIGTYDAGNDWRRIAEDLEAT